MNFKFPEQFSSEEEEEEVLYLGAVHIVFVSFCSVAITVSSVIVSFPLLLVAVLSLPISRLSFHSKNVISHEG
jgi:hypothetical protein